MWLLFAGCVCGGVERVQSQPTWSVHKTTANISLMKTQNIYQEHNLPKRALRWPTLAVVTVKCTTVLWPIPRCTIARHNYGVLVEGV